MSTSDVTEEIYYNYVLKIQRIFSVIFYILTGMCEIYFLQLLTPVSSNTVGIR